MGKSIATKGVIRRSARFLHSPSQDSLVATCLLQFSYREFHRCRARSAPLLATQSFVTQRSDLLRTEQPDFNSRAALNHRGRSLAIAATHQRDSKEGLRRGKPLPVARAAGGRLKVTSILLGRTCSF